MPTRHFQQPPLARLSTFSLDRKPLTPFSLTYQFQTSRAFIGALLLWGFGMATILIVEDQEQILILVKSFV
jgi:hypothetical protein